MTSTRNSTRSSRSGGACSSPCSRGSAGVTLAALLLAALAPSLAFSEDPPTQGAPQVSSPEPMPSPAAKEREGREPSAAAAENWRKSMANVPVPKKGCFKAVYPRLEWQEVPCTSTPPYPQPPRRGPRPFTVGNSNDIAAQVPSGFISSATGSFDSVSNVTSESGPIGNSGPSIANAYTLQLNTNFFSSTVCNGAANPAICSGWQQFVFENNGSSGRAYIQYWLLKYNKTCPSGQGWNQFSFNGSTDIYCWKNNSGGAVSIPVQPITNLGNLSLTGSVSSTGDSVTVSTGSQLYTKAGDNAVNAAAGWQIAEFNIFGDGGNSAGGGQASFNSGASLITRTRVIYGGRDAPSCAAQGFTAETNNLSFGPSAPGASQPGPAVIFSESSAGGATSNCAAATTVGDTHLTTFSGLLYDFQASGDFVLAEAEPKFVVQTRQVSGAPTWPNASVNSAVATRMGSSTVALCLPNRLTVNGKGAELGNGGTLSLPDGVGILRMGNVYLITDETGNSVRAEINPTWINVSVGLGHWPAKVRGLLANPQANVAELEARSGARFKLPIGFDDLYRRYGDSWRVQPKESLLSVCGERNVEHGNPGKTFYAPDLGRERYQRARAICTGAGVRDKALLDACTLDVTVIGNPTAANVFAHTPAPVKVLPPPKMKDHDDYDHDRD